MYAHHYGGTNVNCFNIQDPVSRSVGCIHAVMLHVGANVLLLLDGDAPEIGMIVISSDRMLTGYLLRESFYSFAPVA